MRGQKTRWLLAGINLLLVGIISYVGIIGERGGKDGKTTIAGYTLSRHLPDYARLDNYTLASYMIAVELSGALELIPCYCSCDVVGHEDLEDCFLQGEGFTPHGANCGICKVEAVRTAELLLEKGMSLREARASIEQQFGNGRYGRPTPTPPIVEEFYLADLAPGLDREAFQRALRELLD